MKVLVDNDWVKRAAEIEDGCEVGAGVMHPEAPNSHAEMLSVIATQAARLATYEAALREIISDPSYGDPYVLIEIARKALEDNT